VALRDAIPLYPLYPVLFADHGLSTAAISALYVLWSSTGIVLQLPTGVLADHVSRRLLLVVAGFLRVVGFGAWIVVPSFAGFAAGFVLWGLSSALQDGTFEALVYDELAAVGATDTYGRLRARSGTGGLIASAVATALAVPLFRFGGFELVGWVSVAVCAIEGLVALSLPARPRVAEASEGGLHGYVETLRIGIVEAATRPSVRGVVLLLAVLPALTAIDEYVPLVGDDYHVPTSVVPVFLLVITLTAAIGNWAAGRWWSVRGSRMAGTLALGAAALAASGLTDRAAGFTGVAIAFGVVQFGITSAEIRLQHAITGRARATVTSVASVGADVFAVVVFAASAAIAQWLPVTDLLAAFALPLFALAVLTPRWLRYRISAAAGNGGPTDADCTGGDTDAAGDVVDDVGDGDVDGRSAGDVDGRSAGDVDGRSAGDPAADSRLDRNATDSLMRPPMSP
jgi:MFS family permease